MRNPVEVGAVYGACTVLARLTPKGTRHTVFRVRCRCGTERDVSGGTLSAGLGCRNCKRGGAKRKYGDRVIQNFPLYNRWAQMKHRCYFDGEDNRAWHGRGITVCDEWRDDYLAFERWSLTNGYKQGLSLDRVNVDGNYEPSNCQWVTRSINSKRARAEYHRPMRKTQVAELLAAIQVWIEDRTKSAEPLREAELALLEVSLQFQ